MRVENADLPGLRAAWRAGELRRGRIVDTDKTRSVVEVDSEEAAAALTARFPSAQRA
jgi:hypothetical protein